MSPRLFGLYQNGGFCRFCQLKIPCSDEGVLNMEKTSAASPVYRKERSNTGFWLVVLGAALWGVDPLFRIILLNTMTSTQIVLVEHIIVSLIAIPVLWKFRADLKNLRARHWIAVIFISWGGSALATVLFTMALTHNDPNTVLLLQKCNHSSLSCWLNCY